MTLLFKGSTLNPISREQTAFLKGIAILLIVFHNYYKWVLPITGENEFWFSADYIGKSLVYLRSDPMQFLNIFFSFLGFYGVQLFMVISAYGLTRSWNREPTGYGRFVIHRFDKLYPSLFFAAVLFIIINIIREARMPGPDLLKDMLYQLALVPCRPTGISGPWWFYSFIFQFYLVFPVMMWVNRKAGSKGLAGLVIIGYIVTIFLYAPLKNAGYNPYYLFIGHMPEFCFGIWLATREHLKIPYVVSAGALAMLILGNIYEWAWPFANISAALLLLQVIRWMWSKKERMRFAVSVVSFIGTISMYLFASHGLFRNGFINLANYFGSPWAALLIGIAFVAFSAGISWMMMNTEGSFRAWVRGAGKMWHGYLRFFSVILLVTGTVALLFCLDNRTTANLKKAETIVSSRSDSFETLDDIRQRSASTEIVHSGRQCQLLPPPEYFSASINMDLDKNTVNGLTEAVSSVWLYTSDSLAQGHLVFEVIDLSTNKIMEWKSQFVTKDKFEKGKWFLCEYHYLVPPDYRHTGYRFKTFVWNNSPGRFWADDLKLELKARR